MIGSALTTLAAYVHRLDPYALGPWEVGPFEHLGVRWYGLSYVSGFVVSWLIIKVFASKRLTPLKPVQVSDFVLIVAIGTVLGGRIGYCLFYRIDLFWEFTSDFPWWGVAKINQGGMASHGGILGIMTACLLFARRHTITPLHLFDLCTLTGTIGVFFGRIANFINSELLGRPCDPTLPWAVEFPKEITEWPAREPERLGDLAPIIGELGTSEVGVTVAEWQAAAGGFAGGDPTREQIDIVTQVTERIVHVVNSDRAAGDTVAHMLDPLLTARHPSQIYAALLEGLALFIVLAWLWRKPRKPGIVTGAFLVGYAIVRIINEQWRMPDAHIGFQALGLTRGQWLSVAMLAVGVTCMIIWSRYDIPRLGGWMTGPASEAVPNTELNDQDKEAP